MTNFNAYRIFESEGRSAGRLVQMSLDELDQGEVVIECHFSSVNFKDALAATGSGKVIRRFPCVGGIDVAGVVASSSDARFAVGDEVLVTGYDLGVAHDGGYAEYARVPANWVVRIPSGLSMFDAMALGTAGFTAALAIHRLEQNDLSPSNGKIIVTGATGGVSSLGIQMLSQLGYQVVALTGKDEEHEYLKSIGAVEIISRKDLVMGIRPLEKGMWAGALDSVGGETLAWLIRTMKQEGAVASFGNAGGFELNTTVLPFILRGVRLLGVDSAATAMTLRRKLWERLASDLYPQKISQVAKLVHLADLPDVFPKLMQSKMRGRVVVSIKSSGK